MEHEWTNPNRMVAQPRLVDRLNLVWTLLWRNFLPRNRRESFRLFWVIAEPTGQLAVMIILFSIIGRTAGYGRSFALFLLTGIALLTLFSRGSQVVASAVKDLSSPARLPAIGVFHDAIAKILFEAIVAIAYFVIVAAGIAALQDTPVARQHPERAAAAFLWTALAAYGFGLLRGYMMIAAPPVERIYAILARVLIFVSGVFYVPSFMPEPYRSWLSWNPVLHGVELLRLGVYDQYPTIVYSPDYLIGFALGTTAFGMALVWRNRVRMLG